jgi:hypothetical protein
LLLGYYKDEIFSDAQSVADDTLYKRKMSKRLERFELFKRLELFIDAIYAWDLRPGPGFLAAAAILPAHVADSREYASRWTICRAWNR